ncbi:hypothetical protein ACP70R_047660 [Stipagrostis hirtigluma subsp. patula]
MSADVVAAWPQVLPRLSPVLYSGSARPPSPEPLCSGRAKDFAPPPSLTDGKSVAVDLAARPADVPRAATIGDISSAPPPFPTRSSSVPTESGTILLIF